MAGGAPRGEINSIRELMPKSHILAVDNDPRCLEAAIDAGADDIAECDVLDCAIEKSENAGFTQSKRLAPDGIRGRARFDLINLDLCGGATPRLLSAISFYMRTMVVHGGVFMLTFSYGRDVAELYMNRGRQWQRRISQYGDQMETLSLPDDVPESVSGRIMYLCSPSILDWLRSISIYRGAEMPMCSLVFQVARKSSKPISFLRVEPGDFELSVVYPSAVNLYDCPQQRIDSLRRQFAAIKAAITRKEAEANRDKLFA